jgi:hypothetical protein
MALPHFLGVGVQKAATSWLWSSLRQHPEVWMPPVKELHYFDHMYVPDNRAWTTWHNIKSVIRTLRWHFLNADNPSLDYLAYVVELGRRELFTEDWYRFAFSWDAAENKILGDITPEYCTIPMEGIKYVNPNYSRRNVKGAVSLY